jgi:predicted MFS family arabinose efflux permease
VDLTGEERRGTAYGLYDLMQNLGLALGPLLGGFLYDSVGRQSPFYLAAAVLLASAIWVVLFLRRSAAESAEAAAP